MKNDPVNHPSHYTQGGIECIDALTAMITPYEDPNDAALTWQVGKYIWRHPFKAKPIEDLRKAEFYLQRLIKYLEDKESANKNSDEVHTEAYLRQRDSYEAYLKTLNNPASISCHGHGGNE